MNETLVREMMKEIVTTYCEPEHHLSEMTLIIEDEKVI